MKRYFAAILVLAVTIMVPTYASAALSCAVVTTPASGSVTVFRIYKTSNSHAELPSQSNYTNLVSCSGVTNLSNSCSGNSKVVLKLAKQTNSHVEQADRLLYANSVCLSAPSGATLSVGYQTDNCNGFDTTVASMGSTTNAHVGDANAYPIKICASGSDPAPTPTAATPVLVSNGGGGGSVVITPVLQTAVIKQVVLAIATTTEPTLTLPLAPVVVQSTALPLPNTFTPVSMVKRIAGVNTSSSLASKKSENSLAKKSTGVGTTASFTTPRFILETGQSASAINALNGSGISLSSEVVQSVSQRHITIIRQAVGRLTASVVTVFKSLLQWFTRLF
ncbi:MAG: hypothetical protein HY226_00450 [Candidatus Vogelbacteria bacterium]|nr:hypothetical protein [Candidatus Vogelbacteria bacterium]